MKQFLQFAFFVLLIVSVTGPHPFVVQPPVTFRQVLCQGAKYEETLDSEDLKELQRLIEKYNAQNEADTTEVNWMFQDFLK